MTTANTFVAEDGFGLVQRPDPSASRYNRCYEIVRRYTMTNKGNSSVRLISWGAGIQSIRIPNDRGIFGDVVLGYDSMDGTIHYYGAGYLKNSCFGNAIARVTNRVTPDGQDAIKNSEARQSSEKGEKKRDFDNVNWESCIIGKQVVMSNLSHASIEGWPGQMLTQVKFSWTDENELHMNIRASATEPMPANITTRCLFNLAGHGTGPQELRNHVVTINAGHWTFVDVRDKIPTGAIRPVDSTIYDLRFPTRITSERLRKVPGGGYDHNLCIDAPSCWCYRFHARILHPGSGRFMEVYSNQPGLQFYTGNDLPEPERFYPTDLDDCCWGDCGDRMDSKSILSERENKRVTTRLLQETPCKDGVLYRRHGGFSLSPQNYPNAINIEGFPTCILYPGKIYSHDMTYKFGVLRKN